MSPDRRAPGWLWSTNFWSAPVSSISPRASESTTTCKSLSKWSRYSGRTFSFLNGESNGAPSLATEALHHPIVAKLADRLKLVSMPSRLWTCAGPSVLDAVQLLMDETTPSVIGATP